MADAHVDEDVRREGVRWFKGYGPLPVIGDCLHDCTHSSLKVVAWGPDLTHYTLDECHDEDGCAGRCRGWMAEPDRQARPDGPHRFVHNMKQVRVDG